MGDGVGLLMITFQSACLVMLILIDSIVCECAIAGVNGELPMERAWQSLEGIQLICALSLEPGQGNRGWKVGEVGLKGEEVKDLKKDEQGEWVVMVIELGASEEESGGETKLERLYVGQP